MTATSVRATLALLEIITVSKPEPGHLKSQLLLSYALNTQISQ